jgi:plastocyanin
MAAPVCRPSRLALAALLVAALGVILVDFAGRPASAQAKGTEIAGTAQLKWEPANVIIKPGESVTFKVTGGPPHPVASGDGSNPQGDNKFDASACGLDKMATAGASCTVRYPKAGTFPFFCQTHVSVGMKGVIRVGVAKPGMTIPTAGGQGGDRQVVLLALGAALFLGALAAYIRYAPSFRRESRNR